MTTWEALDGCGLIDTGKKRRNGKPHVVMAMRIIVCVAESDAKLVARKHPHLKFVKRSRRDPRTTSARGADKERR